MSGTSPPDPGAGSLTAITGLAGWWSAASPTGLFDSAGRPLTGWNQAAAGVMDRSGGSHPLLCYSSISGQGASYAGPRLAGTRGGVGGLTQGTNLLSPALSPYSGLTLSGATINSATDWTWWIVWSRPNWRQGTNVDSQPGTILAIGATPILQIDNKGGSGRLTLFPGPTGVVLTTALTRRHTHSIVIRNTQARGIDVWLDGNSVARGAGNGLPSTASGPVYLLHDGTPVGGAQCWFHEAAVWQRSLSDTEINTLLTYASLWPVGARRGVLLVINGQSNALNYALNDGAALLLARGIAWYTGAIAYNIVATSGAPASYTMQSGHGIYAVANGAYPGSFVDGTGTNPDPSAWPPGADGLAVQNALGNLSAEDLSDIGAIVWPWNETDSLRNYGEKTIFQAAAARFLLLERQMIGKTAAQLPLIWWNAIPYGTAQGMQMHREVAVAMAADSARNVVIGNPQTADSNPRGSVWDPTTGISSGGDIAHRDSADNQRFAMLAAPVAARAMLASGNADTLTSIPAGIVSAGGPRITHAYRRDGQSIVLTVQHDAGTDVQVPLRAAAGFTVMDGGSILNPGTLVGATSCQRLDATHLLLQLAQPLTHSSAQCGLYYPYGSTPIGRGNAVTDNYSTSVKPAGWDIGADLGIAWNLDFPLAATGAPIMLSDSPS